MTYEVSITKCDSYELEKVRTSVTTSLEAIGGLQNFVKEGDRVLVKLNLLGAKPPDAAVTTHPAVAQAVVESIQELGATPMVGDAPGGGCSERSSLAAVCRDLTLARRSLLKNIFSIPHSMATQIASMQTTIAT